ncbi:MAG: aryl-sulfate sulfotransferase [Crocinitomicaceae bacterium]|nr:aryl-sulfate sulfotransferase [Crocinitomicaceae bacterium]MDG1775848.1 aryl-sulfate sulfotransferase [Crocinitomicaceae bacterium]
MHKILIILLLFVSHSYGQRTVGVFQFTPDALPGYALFAPSRSPITYLIDNCGEQQFYWQSAYNPGNSVELLENGTLIRACRFANGSPISAGGAGGRIEAINLNQQIDWFFEYSNDTVRLHHDFEVMDNGNVLMIAWELKTQQEAINEGRDPLLVGGSGLWPDHIIEYNPITDQIVWRWNAWDHLIQEFDSTKPNYGVVADHPELFNLNFDTGNGAADWQHLNSVAYNEDLDQIALCSPAWNEVYIIDHSTTTAEAAGHSGGNSGKGGDILWRWGNPEMYGAGTDADQQLFFQHDAHWIPSGYRHENKLILFNNGKNRVPEEYSSVDIIAPSILSNGDYEMSSTGSYLPVTADYIYTAPVPTDFYSRIISSADMLPNGNIIVDEGTQGHFFEIDSLDNVVWDYVNPVVQDSILAQEQVIPGTAVLHNSAFRVRKLAHDYPGVVVLPLTSMGPLELNPYPGICETQLNVSEQDLEPILVYPSPTAGVLFVKNGAIGMPYTICNSLGQVILYGKFNGNSIDVNKLDSGAYFLSILGASIGVNSTTSFFKK